jgi:hypothetical protein
MSRSAEQVYALLVDANPIPDVDAMPETLQQTPHLRVLDPRRDDMQTQTKPLQLEPTPPRTPRRRAWIPAVAAAVVVIVAIGIAALAFRGQETEPATPTEAPTTTLVERIEPTATGEDVARQAIADWNAADVDAFLSHFATDGQFREGAVANGDVQDTVAFYMALQQQSTIGDCSTGDTTVACTTVTTDGVTGPVGLETPMLWSFEIDEGTIASLDWSWASGEGSIFDGAVNMANWIDANHPEIWSASFAADCSMAEQHNCFANKWLGTPAAATEMLALAPEYLNQPSVQSARQFIDDWNAGNADGLFGSFGETAQFSGLPASDPYLRADVEFFMAIENVAAIERCVPDLGSSLVPPLVAEHQSVTCTAVTTDALSGPLGISVEMDWIFRVNDGVITDFQWEFDEGALHPQDVAADMVDWIEITYPDVFEATFAAECSSATEWNCWFDRWAATPQGGAELLRLADEFRAQADY